MARMWPQAFRGSRLQTGNWEVADNLFSRLEAVEDLTNLLYDYRRKVGFLFFRLIYTANTLQLFFELHKYVFANNPRAHQKTSCHQQRECCVVQYRLLIEAYPLNIELDSPPHT